MPSARTRQEIVAILCKVLPQLRREYGVRSLGLFGSYARDQAHEGSDVDLLVEFDETPSLFRLVAMERFLSELLGVSVDLVMRDALKPHIGRRILDEVQLL